MADVQFYHHNRHLGPKYTIAVEVPAIFQYELALKAFAEGSNATFLLPIGKAKVHPNDNFSKKTGRVVSQGVMKNVNMHVVEILVKKEWSRMLVQTENGEAYTFTLRKGNSRVYFRGPALVFKSWLEDDSW